MDNDRIEKHLKRLEERILSIERTVKAQDAKPVSFKHSEYMWEDEVMNVLRLSKSSLRAYRRKGILRFITASGRKIQYLRKDVEDHLNGKTAPKIYAAKQIKQTA